MRSHSWSPWLPTASDQGEATAYTVQLRAQNQGWRRHCFMGDTGTTFMAMCGEEALNHQRGDLASFEGRFPPVRLRRV